MNRHSAQAFTLPHLLAALALTGVAASFAVNSYRKYILDAELRQTQSLMMENSRFLHHRYAQYQRFTLDRNNWPQLPHAANTRFCIRPQGRPHGQLPGKFTLKAVAFDKTRETRILKTNQDGYFTICQSSSSSCDEREPYFKGGSGSDKNCTLYR
ncbi:MAG: pilin [Neisseria sp.]|nr:pilin [Neisseria sp.]